MSELAKTYEVVFAGPPWNEYKKCTGDSCDKTFGLETKGQDVCPCPEDALLEPFYPRRETLSAISKETSKPGAIVDKKRKEAGELIGFAWGFPTSVEDLVAEKYKTETGQELIKQVLNESGVVENVFYFSETGVKPENRGQGISNIFAQTMVSESERLGIPLVMRTNWQSPMVAVAQKFGMQQVLGPEVIRQNGEIRKTGNTRGAMDPENRDRVLYIRTSVPTA